MRKLERGQSWKPKDENQIVCYIAGGNRKIAMLRYIRSEFGSRWGFLYVSSGTYRWIKDMKYDSHDATLAIASAINAGREVWELDGFEELPALIKIHNEQKQKATAEESSRISDALIHPIPVSREIQSLYNEAPSDMQQKMIKIWPHLGSITDRVKSLEDLYACSGVNFGMDGDDEWAYRVLKLLARTLNEGWQPDWDNNNESKWTPWFRMNSASGFSFDGAGCVDWLSDAGSRLCFKTDALAKHAATHFIGVYKKFML